MVDNGRCLFRVCSLLHAAPVKRRGESLRRGGIEAVPGQPGNPINTSRKDELAREQRYKEEERIRTTGESLRVSHPPEPRGNGFSCERKAVLACLEQTREDVAVVTVAYHRTTTPNTTPKLELQRTVFFQTIAQLTP